MPQSNVTPSTNESFFSYSTHESPNSSNSTSRLLPTSLSSFNRCEENGDARRSYSLSRSEEKCRIFIRRLPSSEIPHKIAPVPLTRTFSSSSDSAYQYRSDFYHPGRRYSDVFLSPECSEEEKMNSRTQEREFLKTCPTHSFSRFRSSSAGSLSYMSRTSSFSDVITPLPLNQSYLAQEAVQAPRINRSLTRRSIGQEWTRHHWKMIRELEEESERARRCSKLSSGFAPLMVFGGLVFVCIGISASTNTGKDRERLKDLSAAPLAMGVFMIVLGACLILTWFGCRSRARQLDQKLLHGSHSNLSLSRDNLMQSVVSKFYNRSDQGGIPRMGRTPTFSEMTTNDISEYKNSTLERAEATQVQNCDRCRLNPTISRETSV